MKKIIALILFINTILFSQVYESEDQVMSPASDFYSNNYLYGSNSAKGNTGIAGDNDISAFLLNPAAIKLNKKYTVSIQYSYKTTQKISYTSFSGINSYELSRKPFSLSGGFGMKINKHLTAALIYSNINNVKYDFTGVFTTENDLTYNYNVHSINLPVNFIYNNFSIGINPGFSFYNNLITGATTIIEPNVPHDVTESFERLNIQVGLKVSPAKNISAGLTFTPGFKSDVKFSEDVSVSPNIKQVALHPFKISAGMDFLVLKEKLRLSFDYNFQRTSVMKGYLDKNNFNLGGEYTANKNLLIRAGFFTQFDIRDFHSAEVGFPGKEGEYTQYFITGGFTYKLKNVDLSLNVMDSHISPGIIKITILNGGLTFNF